MNGRDIFAILETEPTEDKKEIKKAYAKLEKNIIRKSIPKSGKRLMMPMKRRSRGRREAGGTMTT